MLIRLCHCLNLALPVLLYVQVSEVVTSLADTSCNIIFGAVSGGQQGRLRLG
jgi:hypothetical protein